MFTISEVEIFHIIAYWYLLFFAKFRSHRVEDKIYDGKSVISQYACIIDVATLRLSVFVWTVLFFCPSEVIKHVQELSVDKAIY